MKRKLHKAAILTIVDLKHTTLEAADIFYELLGEAWHIVHFILEKLWELLEYIMGELPGRLAKGL